MAKKLNLVFKEEKNARAHIASGTIGGKSIILILPDVQMNKAGKTAKAFIRNKNEAKNLLVVRDDIDMGLGSMKLTFKRGSGGHRGTESILEQIKTKEFYQLKLGILPLSPSGRPKKPKGEKKVVSFILSEFKPAEQKIMQTEIKRAGEAIESFLKEGFSKSASNFNT